MKLHLKAVGTGTHDDPFRVDLPHYRLLHHDEDNGVMVVEIPDTEHNFKPETLKQLSTRQVEGHEVHKLAERELSRLHSHFDRRYQEHKGKFRVEQA